MFNVCMMSVIMSHYILSSLHAVSDCENAHTARAFFSPFLCILVEKVGLKVYILGWNRWHGDAPPFCVTYQVAITVSLVEALRLGFLIIDGIPCGDESMKDVFYKSVLAIPHHASGYLNLISRTCFIFAIICVGFVVCW